MADDLATLDAAAKLRATEQALAEVLASRDRERREASQRIAQLEAENQELNFDARCALPEAQGMVEFWEGSAKEARLLVGVLEAKLRKATK